MASAYQSPFVVHLESGMVHLREEREWRAAATGGGGHQQPEVNYLPRFGPQLISLED